MTQPLSEDDIYRASTQYRLWSFSPESLVAIRRKTHDIAIERAHGYADQRPIDEQDGTPDGQLDCLTAEEESSLVQKYTDTLRLTAAHLDFPVHVKATAAQYLKRFYLSNSCMTYPPKEIYKSVLFLANKSDNHGFQLREFARRISTDPEQVLAPEYKIMQALRFTLDVKHPFRGLKGVLMELKNLAEGLAEGADGQSGEEMKQAMANLPAPREGDRTRWTMPTSGKVTDKELDERLDAAYGAAKTDLDAPAMLTDVYFLYTPSQILLAAMHLADEPLTSYYLSTKLPVALLTRPKILATIHACADALASYDPKNVLTKDERATLEKKLEKCRDPSTQDLVTVFRSAKQGQDDDGEKAKRKKLEREKSMKEGEDLFGPSIAQPNGG